MNGRTIGGPIDLAALFGDRPDAAQQHRPRDRREFIREAQRLRVAGLTVDDIATALRLSPGAVRELLTEHLAEVPAKYRRPDL
jgi:hypothetical protein